MKLDELFLKVTKSDLSILYVKIKSFKCYIYFKIGMPFLNYENLKSSSWIASEW